MPFFVLTVVLNFRCRSLFDVLFKGRWMLYDYFLDYMVYCTVYKTMPSGIQTIGGLYYEEICACGILQCAVAQIT